MQPCSAQTSLISHGSRTRKFYRSLRHAVAVIAVAAVTALLSLPAWAEKPINQAIADYDAERFEQALKPLSAAADKGHLEAQYRLAMMYRFAWGVPKDFSRAREIFESAANNGHPEAQSELGKMYKDGRGVKKNLLTAAAWFEKAGMQHQGISQLNLARLYRKGRGVPQDWPRAWVWFSMAISNQYMDAMGHRNTLQDEMTPEQLAQGKQLLAQLQAKIKTIK